MAEFMVVTWAVAQGCAERARLNVRVISRYRKLGGKAVED